MAFYKMPSGHFAYVINESGNRQLVTQEDFENCCCRAPITCPCTTWLPEEWPCSGLLETYSLESWTETDGVTGYLFRLKSPSTLTATGGTVCNWSCRAMVERSIDDGSNWSDFANVDFLLGLSATIGWSIKDNLSLPLSVCAKGIGQTPIGSYSPSTGNTTATVS